MSLGAARGVPTGPRAGFSLVELLVTLAMALLLLVALLGYVRSARNAAAFSEAGSASALALNLAVELLREELRLAGAAPWPRPAAVEEADDVASFLAEALGIAHSASGSSVRVRYVDHRLAGPARARDYTFEAGVDASGDPQLYRRGASGPRQPLVAGITRLAVVGALDGQGRPLGPHELAGREVAALRLELEAEGELRRALVELPARPRAAGP